MGRARKPITDEALAGQAKWGKHRRGEILGWVINWCVIAIVVFITIVLIVLSCLLIKNAVTTQDYERMWDALQMIFGAIGGYLLAYLKQHGIAVE